MPEERKQSDLPDDLLVGILGYLDVTFVVQQCAVVSKKIYQLSNECFRRNWKRSSSAQALLMMIKEAQEDFDHNRLGFECLGLLLAERYDALKTLLAQKYTSIPICLPAYDASNRWLSKSFTFCKRNDGCSRRVYATKEEAEEKIPNISEVNGFFSVNVPLRGLNLKRLCKEGRAYYDDAIEEGQVINFTP